VPHHEDVWVSGGIAPHILNFGTRWGWVVSFTLWPLKPKGNCPWYPLDRKLCKEVQSNQKCSLV